MEERFIDLETRLAFQEHALNQLSEVMAHQQQEIDRLRAQVGALIDRLKALTPSQIARPEEEGPPPHY